MMTFALMLLACGDAPVDSAPEDVEPEWLYGTEVEFCDESGGARVLLPTWEDLRIDVWVCTSSETDMGCGPAREFQWWPENPDVQGVLLSCTANEGWHVIERVEVDWMAPNPEWSPAG